MGFWGTYFVKWVGLVETPGLRIWEARAEGHCLPLPSGETPPFGDDEDFCAKPWNPTHDDETVMNGLPAMTGGASGTACNRSSVVPIAGWRVETLRRRSLAVDSSTHPNTKYLWRRMRAGARCDIA